MSKEEVKYHKAVRGAYRGHCNQDIKRAQRLMADTEVINNTELKAIAERLSRRLDEIKAMDCTILNALGKDEEKSEETDQALTFQDDIYYWVLKIKEFVTDEHYPASTFQTNQHLESTSTFQNYISNHSTETHSNGLRFGIVIVMQYTTIMN